MKRLVIINGPRARALAQTHYRRWPIYERGDEALAEALDFAVVIAQDNDRGLGARAAGRGYVVETRRAP